MKNKISFTCTVILLICMIICLVGYNQIVIQKENEKFQELQSQENKEHQEKKEDTEDPDISNTYTPIYCIGDSLTQGTSSSSYPNVLSSLTGYPVDKIGASSDQTIDIAIKLGRTKIYTQDITIPANVSSVSIDLYNKNGEKIDVLRGDFDNFKTVDICGISGTLSYDHNTGKHIFTRNEKGESKTITTAQEVIASSYPELEKNNISIIFTGTYDANTSNGIFKTITYQRAILNQIHTDNYIIVSLTSKRKFPIVRDMNSVLKEEHGEHFLDFRTYLLENGLKDAGITPTNQDKSDLEKGYIPSSLLKEDKINGNNKFNELLANQIYKKMIELNYIDEQIQED